MHQAKKRFGQNFLTDKNLLKKIVDSAKIKDKNVLEIGPGQGALTQFLVQDAKKYLAYEIDYSLKPRLTDYHLPHTHFIFEDFLASNIESDLNTYFDKEPIHLIGNLPYYITTPIIFKFLELPQIETATIMVQKEVGERMISKNNLKSYNAFSAILQYYTHVDLVMHVGKKMFKPVPKVDSMVVKLTKKEGPLNLEEELLYKRIVKISFMHKRKTLLNNLSVGLDKPKEEILSILKASNYDETTRAEALSVDDFVRLTQKMVEK